VSLLLISYLLGIFGKHQHMKDESRRKHSNKPGHKFFSGNGMCGVAINKLSQILKYKKSSTLSVFIAKTKRVFGAKLSKNTGFPFYMPARGRRL